MCSIPLALEPSSGVLWFFFPSGVKNYSDPCYTTSQPLSSIKKMRSEFFIQIYRPRLKADCRSKKNPMPLIYTGIRLEPFS
jgi:hypothetical protein